MSNTRISNIKIQSFRGATAPFEITFDNKKKAVIIFGENGSGKSSIVDALEYIFCDKCGSLEDISVSAKKESYFPSLGKSSKDIDITISLNNKSFSIKNSTQIDNLRSAVSVNILRKSRILDLIKAIPSDRYNVIKQFIELSAIEKAEESLKEAIKSTKDKLDSATEAHHTSLEHLKSIYDGLQPKPKELLPQWIDNIQGSQKSDVIVKELANLEELNKSVTELTAKITDTLVNRELLATQEKACLTKKTELKDALAKSVGAVDELIDIINHTIPYFKSDKPIDKCPVCESSIDKEQILTKLEERKKSFESINSIKKVLNDAEIERKRLTSLVDDGDKRINQLISVINIALSKIENIKTKSVDVNNNATLSVELNQKLTQIKENKGRLDKIDGQYKIYIENKVVLEKLDSSLKKLNQFSTILQKERKDYVEKVLNEVSQDIEELYSAIHPAESVGKLKFSLDSKQRASLILSGDFYNGKAIEPQAYYSEAHLDTLGICIFLALSKYYSKKSNKPFIVVLDDVISSIDSNHLGRFLDLLSKYSDHTSQVILTTHSRHLKDKYKYNNRLFSKVQIIDLLPWSFDQGIKHSKSKHEYEELEILINQPSINRQSIASKASFILENILDCLTYKYGCKLQRKVDNNYTLNDLLTAINTKLLDALRVEQDATETRLASIVQNLKANSYIRNQVGDHYNIMGSDVSDSDVLEYAKNVLLLSKLLICPECQVIPMEDTSGEYWDCGCGKTKLYPLKHPV